MAIKRLNAIIRKNLSIVFAGLLLSCPLPLAAQFQGFFAQQTVTASSSQTLTASPTHVSLPNLGQAAHTVTFSGNQAVNDCVMSLDASQNGTSWFLLGSVKLANSADPHGITVNGYFPLVRLTFNLESAADCNGASVTANYVGYQFPVPSSGTFSPLGFVQQAITSPVQLLGSTIAAPWQIFSLACTNPTGGSAVAYIQIFDSSIAPTLGTGPIFEIGVPVGQTVNFAPSLPFTGFTVAWIGAATTPTGNTAVGTGVLCSEQYTNDATVWPIMRTVTP